MGLYSDIETSDLIYMAPETLINDDITSQSDIYTLGIILVFCMSLGSELNLMAQQNFNAYNPQSILDFMSNSNPKSILFANISEDSPQIIKCITGHYIQKDLWTPLFLDFVSLCLTFDHQDRLQPSEILSHPVFKDYNAQYIQSETVVIGK